MHSHYRRFGGVSGQKEWPGKEINEMCEEQRRGESETEDRENMFCNGIGTFGVGEVFGDYLVLFVIPICDNWV